MAVLLGVWRNSDGTFANMQAVGLFVQKLKEEGRKPQIHKP